MEHTSEVELSRVESSRVKWSRIDLCCLSNNSIRHTQGVDKHSYTHTHTHTHTYIPVYGYFSPCSCSACCSSPGSFQRHGLGMLIPNRRDGGKSRSNGQHGDIHSGIEKRRRHKCQHQCRGHQPTDGQKNRLWLTRHVLYGYCRY